MYGTSTWRASRMCSRVWGIGPSVAATTRMAPSIWAAPGDHVLDVVGVARAVDVGVVARVGLVLDVGDGDGDAALALLGGVVDRVEGAVLGLALEGEVLGDRRGQARLAVVDVADRADVDVRLGALELLLGHVTVLLLDQCAASPLCDWGSPIGDRGGWSPQSDSNR